MKKLLIIMSCVLFVGCSDRDTPEQQIKDYRVCISAGMNAKLNYHDQIVCIPKGSIVNFSDLKEQLRKHSESLRNE